MNEYQFVLVLSIVDSNFTYPGTFPSRQESHGGDDVAVFALGTQKYKMLKKTLPSF